MDNSTVKRAEAEIRAKAVAEWEDPDGTMVEGYLADFAQVAGDAGSETEMRALLTEAADVLTKVGKAALVVRTTLDRPYPDAPETTPWDRFMRDPASRAYNLGVQIRRRLRQEKAA